TCREARDIATRSGEGARRWLRRARADARPAARLRAHAGPGVLRALWLHAHQPRAAAGEERRGVSGVPEALRVRRAGDANESRRHQARAAPTRRAVGLHAHLPRAGAGPLASGLRSKDLEATAPWA